MKRTKVTSPYERNILKRAHNEVSVLYLISNHVFVCINHKDTFKSDNRSCAQRIIKFTDEKNQSESTN